MNVKNPEEVRGWCVQKVERVFGKSVSDTDVASVVYQFPKSIAPPQRLAVGGVWNDTEVISLILESSDSEMLFLFSNRHISAGRVPVVLLGNGVSEKNYVQH